MRCQSGPPPGHTAPAPSQPVRRRCSRTRAMSPRERRGRGPGAPHCPPLTMWKTEKGENVQRTMGIWRTVWATVILGLFVNSLGLGASAQTTVQQLASRTQTDTTTITTPYATNGRTRTWSYTWNSSGQLLTVDGPRPGTGDTTTYTYNASGFLASVTDPVGHVTTISAWTGSGLPLTVIDANSVTTNLTYDIHGRLLTVTVDPGATQSQYVFEYDVVGN